jgi:hypothetical protein
MSEESKTSVNIYADNALKFLLTGLIAVMVWVSKQQIDRLDRIESDVSTMKIQLAEMRSDLRYLAPKQ